MQVELSDVVTGSEVDREVITINGEIGIYMIRFL